MEQLHKGTVIAETNQLSAAVNGYLVALTRVSSVADADVLAELRELEKLRRRLATADHTLIAELDRRGLAGRLVMPSTSAVLQGLLRLSPHESKQRVRAARACGPRTSLTGEALPALLPQLAAAQAAGQVSPEHGRVIEAALSQLPATVSAEDHALAEKHLVQAAATLRHREVGLLGQRILAHLHPDGVLADDAEQQRHRGFALHPEADGSYRAAGRLTPACGAQLLAWLTPRSAPQPSDDTGPDPRSHGQRMHDALEQLAGLAIRRTELVESGAQHRSSSP